MDSALRSDSMMIRIVALEKTYELGGENRVRALRGVHLEVERGAYLAVERHVRLLVRRPRRVTGDDDLQ